MSNPSCVLLFETAVYESSMKGLFCGNCSLNVVSYKIKLKGPENECASFNVACTGKSTIYLVYLKYAVLPCVWKLLCVANERRNNYLIYGRVDKKLC